MPVRREVLADLGGPRPPATTSGILIEEADHGGVEGHRALRHWAFVEQQGLFDGSDHDDLDDDPATVVLVARTAGGEVAGGVRLAPVREELGWWAGSRLVVAPGAPHRTGAALVQAACARAEDAGALRFDALVQADKERFFARLGWQRLHGTRFRGIDHTAMTWPIATLARAAEGKRSIGEVLGDLRPGGAGFVGDDGAPVPGSDLVAATDAIVPSMVERDPWWAGWCSVLVNVNDLAAMGAEPVGLLDAVAAPTPSLARRVVAGLTDAAGRWGVPVLGGHTQVGVPAALAVTMLGRTSSPVPGGGGRAGDVVRVVADLGGGWRPGYGGRQWDSTTGRSGDELRRLGSTLSRWRPAAAKDVSMAGLVGTLAMLAESSGCGAELDVATVPRPAAAGMADWLTCFPGFALVTAGGPAPGEVTPAVVGDGGRLVAGEGTSLLWPDGVRTVAVAGAVVGLGAAGGAEPARKRGAKGAPRSRPASRHSGPPRTAGTAGEAGVAVEVGG